MIGSRLGVAAEVGAALAAGRPVVALESYAHQPRALPYPQKLEVARASEAAVREAGAIPPRVAIRDGRFVVGLDDVALGRSRGARARAEGRAAESRRGPRPIWMGRDHVSATMIAARAAGIDVFARRNRRRPPRTGRLTRR